MEVPPRAAAVRRSMIEAELDALWITNPANVRWLTGFTGSNGRLLLTADELVAVTDGRSRVPAVVMRRSPAWLGAGRCLPPAPAPPRRARPART
ncbi:MAG: aminopeptidase P family N-terminal domain-containing protein [Actinomycetota bacterium]